MNEPLVEFQGVSFQYPETDAQVLDNVNLSLPQGICSLMGQNGTGKSTFLLLASGRLLPTQGKVILLGEDTKALDEVKKQPLASLVYQNMDFETEEHLGDLLSFVYEQGYLSPKNDVFLREIINIFELSLLLKRKTHILAKGEMQRAVMAFALLFGSKSVFMDEPVFAMEDYQKHRTFEYLCDHARSTGRSFYFSIHEFELSKKYSDYLLLFPKSGHPESGLKETMFTREKIEQAYQVPLEFLHQKENLYRKMMNQGTPGSLSPEILENTRIL